MKKIITPLFLLITSLIVVSSCTNESIDLESEKIIRPQYLYPKPKPVTTKNSRVAYDSYWGAISYSLSPFGYQYSDHGSGFTKQVTAWFENSSNKATSVSFHIGPVGGNCLTVKSIDAIYGGGTATNMGPNGINWTTSLNGGDDATLVFTLEFRWPYSCVESAWAMQLTSPYSPSINYTDDYLYLIQ